MNIKCKHPNQQKQEPPILPFTPSSPVEGKAVEDTFRVKYFAWLILRLSSKDQNQIHPTLFGFLLCLMRKQSNIVRPTKYTDLLATIRTKDTNLGPFAYIDFLQKHNVNMYLQQCNIKLHVGTAMNVFLMKWQIEKQFKNIIILVT